MSTAIAKNFQVGSDGTATNNFTIRQPATPDGTVRIANGNSGTTTDLVTVTSAGNVGVGTTSPGAKLDVSGDIIGRATTLRFKDSGNTTQYGAIYADSTTFNVNAGVNNLLLYSAGTERMRLDSSGNLGLGVTPSAWVAGYNVMQVGNASWYTDNNANTYFAANTYQSSGFVDRYILSQEAAKYEQLNGAHRWYTAPSGTAGNAISFTQAMTLNSGGNLGVGTTTINYRVVADCAGSSSNDNGISVYNDNNSAYGGSYNFEHKVTSGGSVVRAAYISSEGGGGTSFLRFATTNASTLAERIRITSGGDLLINTTTSSGLLTVARGASGVGVGATHSGDAGASAAIRVSYTASSGTAYQFDSYFNGSRVGYISSTSTATAYNTSSDYRLKENIQPMTGALAKVAALKPCTYNWKVDGSDGEGFIAHELAEVVPQAVTGDKDAMDEEGNPKYQGIDTSFLVATLTAAIQELKAELDSVKTELALLKGTA